MSTPGSDTSSSAIPNDTSFMSYGYDITSYKPYYLYEAHDMAVTRRLKPRTMRNGSQDRVEATPRMAEVRGDEVGLLDARMRGLAVLLDRRGVIIQEEGGQPRA